MSPCNLTIIYPIKLAHVSSIYVSECNVTCLDNVPDPGREAAAVDPAVLGDADDVGQVRLDHDAAAELADERLGGN